MGIHWKVQVLPRAGHRERSGAQLREGDRPWEGSAERKHGPMNKNRIRGAVWWGERANDREAPMTKTWRRRSGGRVRKVDALTWGGLALRLKGRRRLQRSEESAEAVVVEMKPVNKPEAFIEAKG